METRSRTEYSILNIATGIGGYFLNTILGFICRMVFVRCLAAEYLGVNGLFTNILTMLSLAELGVGNAIVFALYKPLANNDEDRIAALMKVYSKAYRTIGICITVIGLALLPFLNVLINDQPNITESIYLLYIINLFNTASTYFFSYKSSLLIAAQRNYIVSGINYIITIIQSILQMIFLLLFKNYLGYLLIQTAGTFIYNVLVSFIAVKQFPCITKKNIPALPQSEQKQLFANIRDLTIYKISGLLVNSTDNILITFFKGLEATGVTSNYTLLVNTLSSLLNQMFNNLTASIGNHNASENIENQYDMFKFLNMMNFWIFSWVTIGIYFCSSDIVQICFGEQYVLSDSIPMIMAINFYISGVSNIIATYKHTLGFFKQGRFIQLATGIINIILSVVFGSIWGVFGILLATAVARACTHLWYTPYVVYKYGFNRSVAEYWRLYLKYLLITICAIIICKVSFTFLTGNYIVKLLLKVLLCSIVVNFCFILTLYRTKEYARLKQYVKYIFTRR